MAAELYRQTILPTLSLFTSLGTLVCCALPALFVTLGMGAALAGLISSAPWLVTISEYKLQVFLIAGVLLAISLTLQWRSRRLPCPVNENQAKACQRLRKFSWVVLSFSLGVYLIGFYFAFVASKI